VFSFGQTTTGISLNWDKEVGCQTYDFDDRKKALSSTDKEVILAVDSYPAGMYMLVVKQADTLLWQNKLIIK
jgi:hypothetical protein